MADKNSPCGDQGHTKEKPTGSERGRQPRADTQPGIQLWEEIWGGFLVSWKANSRTRWLLPDLRTKGQGRRHRGWEAGQAPVWAPVEPEVCIPGKGRKEAGGSPKSYKAMWAGLKTTQTVLPVPTHPQA